MVCHVTEMLLFNTFWLNCLLHSKNKGVKDQFIILMFNYLHMLKMGIS